MNLNPESRAWFDLPGLSEAEIARLVVAYNRVERAREDFRRKAQGLTEPRGAAVVRGVGFPDAYHDAEHEKRLDIILKAISLG